MLFVGIDWAEAEHAVCLLAASGAVLGRLRVPHSAAGLRRLHAAIAAEAPEPAAVHVALERAHGLLVDALLQGGYAVYGLNPKAVERYRDRTRTAGAKTEPADAERLARIVLAPGLRLGARVLRRQAGGREDPLPGAAGLGQPVAGGPPPPARHGPALRRRRA